MYTAGEYPVEDGADGVHGHGVVLVSYPDLFT